MTRRRRSQVMYVYSGPTDRWPLGEPAEMFPVPQPGVPLAGSPSGLACGDERAQRQPDRSTKRRAA